MPTVTTEELFRQSESQNTISTEELFAGIKPGSGLRQPVLQAARSPLNLKPLSIEEAARLANIHSIHRLSGKSLSEVEREYEGKTSETGLRRTFDIGMSRGATYKQLLEGITDPLIKTATIAGMATNPIATLKGLAVAYPVFKGIDKLTQKGVELLPQQTPRDLKELIETGGYLGGLYAGGKIMEKAPGVFSLLKQKSLIKKRGRLRKEAIEEYRDILRPTQGEIKSIEILKGKNINDYYELAAEEQLPIGRTSDKKIDTTLARDISKKRGNIVNEKISERLKSNKIRMFNLLKLREGIKNSLKESIKNATELKDAFKQVNEYIHDEISRYGENVNGEQLNQIKQGMWSVGYNLLKPTSKSIARRIGFAAKNAINDAFPGVRELNELSGKYATLSDLLENAQGRVITGGRIGRYFAKTIGAIAGSKIPIAGPIAGQYLGGKVSEYISSPERASRIAARKAQQAGIVGKSFRETINNLFPEVIP